MSYGPFRKRGGGGGGEYAKIFCDIFARVSVKNLKIFPNIFPLEPNFLFSFMKKIRSAYFNMHIEKIIQFFFQKSAKHRFLPYGGGAQPFTDWSVT